MTALNDILITLYVILLLRTGKLKHEMKFKPIVDLDLIPPRQVLPSIDIGAHMDQLEGEIKACVAELQGERLGFPTVYSIQTKKTLY